MISPDGRMLRTNEAYRSWLDLPDELPAGFGVDDLPLVAVDAYVSPLPDDIVNSRRSSLNIAVVAEGVEDEADWAAPRALGCPSAQGYYFSKPLPAAGFEQDVLQRSRMATTP